MSDLKSVSGGVQVPSATPTDFVVPPLVPVPEPETGLTVKTFETISVGDPYISASDGFSSGGVAGYCSNEKAWSGAKSARCSTIEGDANSNNFGGWLQIPNNVYKGQEIWYQATIWFDSDFVIGGTTQPTTKFLRFTTSNVGHVDLYMTRDTPDTFKFVSEVTDPAQQFVGFGGGIGITRGGWATYEFYMKADNIPVDEGGQGIARFWKNGIMLGEFTNLRTLRSADAYVQDCIMFTYWNGANGVDVPPLQGCWVDDIKIQTSQPSKFDIAGNRMIGV